MILQCRYYSNQARLANSLQFLSDQPSFRFFCVNGLVTRTRKEFKVISDTVTVVASCVMPETGKASMMLITSDPVLASKDGQEVDTETVRQDGVNYNLCQLLKEKHAIAFNPMCIVFDSDGGDVIVSIGGEEDTELTCMVKTSEGEIGISGDDLLRSVLHDCTVIQSFTYTTATADFKRNVSISEGSTEILKEIARYLNRTLVFVSFMPGNELLEQYVSSVAALEVITRSNGVRVYKKVAGSKLRPASPFCVYQSTARIDDIMREQGRALDQARRG